MKMRVLVSALVIMAVCVPIGAHAGTILAPGSLWEYTFTAPAAGWNTSTGGWSTGPAPFGNYTSGSYDPMGYFSYQTLWPADVTGTWTDDVWVRTTIDLTGYQVSTITWDLGVDNGYTLYANGTLVSSGNAEGYTYRWEYSGAFPAGTLNPGTNVIALALEDHGGLTAFDMQITGAVPEPTTMLLLGFGLVGLVGVRRFRK